MFLFIVFMDGFTFCLVYGLHGVRCSFQEADTCMLCSLGFICRGGCWYVMCAKSVAVTWPCAHCFDKNCVFLCF